MNTIIAAPAPTVDSVRSLEYVASGKPEELWIIAKTDTAFGPSDWSLIEQAVGPKNMSELREEFVVTEETASFDYDMLARYGDGSGPSQKGFEQAWIFPALPATA